MKHNYISFAISTVTGGPIIEDVAELAQLQIEQNLEWARHDVTTEEWKRILNWLMNGACLVNNYFLVVVSLLILA